MRRQTILVLILLAVVSLSGIVITQIFWVKRAYNLQEKQFNDRVVIALSQVVDRIQEVNRDSAFVEPVNQVSSSYFVANINDTLHPYFLESLLREEFESFNLKEEFEYAIYDCFSDSVVYGGRVNFNEKTGSGQNAELSIQRKFNQDGHYFGIYFPQKTTVIIKQMDFWVFSSIVILLVVLFFAYSILIILRQKRLSEVKTDFINNMTHELKTPISTIGISSEMLMRDDISQDASRLKQYATIIKNENNRLKSQVERVLQIASLTPGELQLKEEQIDMEALIEKCVDTLSLMAQEKGGSITFKSAGGNNAVKGDRVHLTNVIFNLMDNAIKYTRLQPQITIGLSNNDKWVMIEVADNGIGIDDKNKKMIFDKFFRVPTGNVHNVKGFGLGLFYVKSIVRAHGGTIDLQSELGKGSTFTIRLKKLA
ncbi:MAG: GHKL domain-containing protein [Cryomorphaceae bacterium]|nr:GHKL domain-containing protein [Cryomorphaceae bacterium]